MMLFLARSALCIGLVAAAGAGVGVGEVTTALERGTRASAASAGRACLASAGCLRAGVATLQGAGARMPGLRDDAPPPRRPVRPPRVPPDARR